MSREAMEAVQDHSQITDPFGINIFVTIGRFVAADTKTGWASDRTIAELARCDKDSIGTWRDKLVSAGEIETWTTGAGRGTKRYYKFLLPFNQPKREPVIYDDNEELSQMSRPEGDNKERDNNNELSQRVDLLSQRVEEMSRQFELLSQMIVPNVPPRGGQEHHNTLETPKRTPQLPKNRAGTNPPPRPEMAESGGCGGDFADVVKAYENNIGGITKGVSELIGEAIEVYPVDWIIDAIGIAVKNNSLKWNYVEGVLKKWQVHGRGYSPKTNGHHKPPVNEEFTADAIKNRLKRKREEANEVG